MLLKRQFLFGINIYIYVYIYIQTYYDIYLLYTWGHYFLNLTWDFQQLPLETSLGTSDAFSLDDARLAQRVAQDLAPRVRNSSKEGQTCGKTWGN